MKLLRTFWWFIWTRIATATNINGTSAEIKGILVDTNGHLAANEGEVDKLEGMVTFRFNCNYRCNNFIDNEF